MEKRALSVNEVAAELGIAAATVRTMLETGQLVGCRIGNGGKWIVARESVDDLFKVKVA